MSESTPTYSELVLFGQRSWADIQRVGYRKTSGAMIHALRASGAFGASVYVYDGDRWGWRVQRHSVAPECAAIGIGGGLPLGRVGLIDSCNLIARAATLRRELARLRHDPKQRVIWYYSARLTGIVERLPRSRAVYEHVDAFEDLYPHQPDRVGRLNDLSRRAANVVDLVLAVTPMLATMFEGTRARVATLPNGVFREFLETAQRPGAEPAVLADLPRPRLCVVAGEWTINHRLDHAFLGEVLDRLPEWSLVLVGAGRPATPGLTALLQRPNARGLPLTPLFDLIPILSHCDVGAIPYPPPGGRRDALKLYEYLACGLPVVVTSEEVRPELAPFVVRAGTPAAFADGCRRAAEDRGRDRGAVRRVLEGMTWEERAARALALLASTAPRPASPELRERS